MTAPLLEDGVALRPLRADDAPGIVAYASSRGFFRLVPEVPDRLRETYTLQDAEAFIAEAEQAWRAGWPTWGIEQDGLLVGTIRITPVPWHAAGAVGYGLHLDARGRGLATRALRMVLAWCQRVGRPPPAAHCDPDNDSSQRVLRRCGYRPAPGGQWMQPQA